MGLGLKKNNKFYQGFFKPNNREKYIGKELPIYRSGLELKFFKFLDNNEKVLRWSSEPFAIPYFDTVEKRSRKYYIDNFVEIQEGTIVKKYLVEIKPHKQTIEPKATKGKKKSSLLYEQLMWINNSNDKWPAARKFAKEHDMEFIIITDKDLG